MPTTLKVTTVAAMAVLVLPAAAVAQSGAQVEVVDSSFQPAEVSVEAGGTVTWTQSGSLPHSVTADDGSFDSHPQCGAGGDCMGTGDTFAQTFTAPGEHPYYCRLHGAPGGVGMAGVVVVTAAEDESDEAAPDTDAGPEADADTEAEADADTGAGADAGAEATDTDLPRTGAPLALLLVVAVVALGGGAVALRRPTG